MECDFLELTHHGEIVLGQERMKILEDKDGWLHVLDHKIESL